MSQFPHANVDIKTFLALCDDVRLEQYFEPFKSVFLISPI